MYKEISQSLETSCIRMNRRKPLICSADFVAIFSPWKFTERGRGHTKGFNTHFTRSKPPKHIHIPFLVYVCFFFLGKEIISADLLFFVKWLYVLQICMACHFIALLIVPCAILLFVNKYCCVYRYPFQQIEDSYTLWSVQISEDYTFSA